VVWWGGYEGGGVWEGGGEWLYCNFRSRGWLRLLLLALLIGEALGLVCCGGGGGGGGRAGYRGQGMVDVV